MQAIGKHGAEGMLRAIAGSNGSGAERPLRVLTHCNTGALATAAYGTALGVVRSLGEQGRLERTYCTETRPYNQGAFHCLPFTALQLPSGLPKPLLAKLSHHPSCNSSSHTPCEVGTWQDADIVGSAARHLVEPRKPSI